MLQRWILLIFLGICSGNVAAQNLKVIDSLKSMLETTSGKEKFEVLNALGFEYRLSFPDTTIYYSQQAYDLGVQIGLKKDLARAQSFIGLAKKYQGDYKGSFQSSLKAIDIAKEQKDSVQLGYCYNNFGRLFFDQGDVTRSYDNFILAQQIFQDIHDDGGLAYVYRSLSDLYKSQSDYLKALDMSTKAYEIRKKIGEPRMQISSLAELGAVYGDMKNKLDAINCFEMADSIARRIGDHISSAETEIGLAEFLVGNGEIARAEELSNNAFNLVESTGNERLLPRSLQLLGIVDYEKRDFQSAIAHFKHVISITEKSHLDLQRDAYFYLSKIYERLGRQADATQATIKYLILKESLQNVELARQIEKLQFQLEIEKRELENSDLRAKQSEQEAIIKQQRLQNILLVVASAFACALFFIQWRHSRKRKEISERLGKQNEEIAKQDQAIRKQNEKLERHNQELSELNHEKDTLTSIVVHDLKSPLNRIKGLVELIEMESNLSENHRKYLNHIRDSTRSGLDLITDLLDVNSLEVNREPKLTSFDLNDLIEDRVNTYSHHAIAKQTDVHVSGKLENRITSDADYLSRIVDNLLSNAIKFSPKGSIVKIQLEEQDGFFIFSIKDQGPGFSGTDQKYLFQKFKKLSARPTAGESSNGLGLAIVKILVDRLGGEIALESEVGKGSTFTVRLPVKVSVSA